MKISLIISVFDNLPFLELVLQSIERQSVGVFEVIVAEDNNSEQMFCYLEKKRKNFPFPLKHVSQKHDGFGKNRILNKAIGVSLSKYLLFIDGDCILHRHFVREYSLRIREDICLFGRRVSLDSKLTEKLVKTADIKKLTFFSILFSRSKRKEEALFIPVPLNRQRRGVWGCSFCVSKQALIAINGFDEDYTRPYFGEDTDIEWRLRALGIRTVSIRNKAIQYHLYHSRSQSEESWRISYELFKCKVAEGRIQCKNGIQKLS